MATARSNSEELAAGTHPRGFVTRYLAEGVVNAFFDTEIAVLNPTTTPAIALLRIQPQGAAERSLRLEVPPLTRRTVAGATLATLTGAPFATVVESDQAARRRSHHALGRRRYGAHAETAVPSRGHDLVPRRRIHVGRLRALLPAAESRGRRPCRRPCGSCARRRSRPSCCTYSLPPQSRTTIPVDSLGPELASTDVSGVVTASAPIIVERAMYLSRPDAGRLRPATRAPA